jgi:hypothetical protein
MSNNGGRRGSLYRPFGRLQPDPTEMDTRRVGLDSSVWGGGEVMENGT